MILYATTIFFSSFLLFLVQPVISKQILPWFGGSAAVWTTCLVFFQSALLAGYAYTDASVRRFGLKKQVTIHTTLLLASLAVLPIIPGLHWKPTGHEDPVWLILLLLTLTIGLPYFLLSTTNPLMQSWLSVTRPASNPYRLFALSNLASMLALVGYPLLVEPWATTRQQGIGWSAGYAIFVVLCAVTAWHGLLRAGERAPATDAGDATPAGGFEQASKTPAAGLWPLWFALAAAASILLLAVTNQITRNIVAVPMLWIAPLVVYLLTFILVFDSSRWYRRKLFVPLVAIALSVMGLPLEKFLGAQTVLLEIGFLLVGLFLTCMFAHGELAQLKPAPRFLTGFYMMVSLGGATGAALVGIVAPLVLTAYFELSIGLVFCAMLLYWQARPCAAWLRAIAVLAILVTILFAGASIRAFYAGAALTARSFYGVLRVVDDEPAGQPRQRKLIDGVTVHGVQLLEPGMSGQPTSYYSRSSGIGRLLTGLNRTERPLHVGIVGLGAGTLAAYGRPGDRYRFYEINPDVVRIADSAFTFLGSSAAKVSTSLGDARLALEREAPQRFDVLVVDAFSSDAIPAHLVTQEAVSLYRRHLASGGAIAFHISNRYLDLLPVISALGRAHGLPGVSILDSQSVEPGSTDSHWVLLAEDSRVLELPGIAEAASSLGDPGDARLWTDDFSSLLQILR